MLALEVSEETGTDAVSSRFFAQLAEFGVRVSLDDFGTGFASLESLGGWPIDELKLDMSIVRPIASNAELPHDRPHHHRPRPSARRQGGRRGGRVRGRQFRAEALGCDIGQGFFLGRPMSAAAFTDWLRDRDRLVLRRGVVTTLRPRRSRPPARPPARGWTSG